MHHREVADAAGRPRSSGQTSLRIGVVDSGWNRALIEPRVGTGVGFVDPEDELRVRRSPDDHDRIGHGTACTDILLRYTSVGDIVPLRIFGRRLESSPSMLIDAIEWAIAERIKLLSLSLQTTDTRAVRALAVVCERARGDGMIIVAAGAHPSRGPAFPAALDAVIGVIADPSARDAGAVRVVLDSPYDCAAQPRHWARGSDPAGRRTLWQGVSMATAVVTACLAGMVAHCPSLDVDDVRSRWRLDERGVTTH